MLYKVEMEVIYRVSAPILFLALTMNVTWSEIKRKCFWVLRLSV